MAGWGHHGQIVPCSMAPDPGEQRGLKRSPPLLPSHALCLELGAQEDSFSQRRLGAETGLLLVVASPWGFQDINHVPSEY